MKDHLKDSSEDYLWDRSGDLDPEIQNLENMLGTLRYQPRPLLISKESEIRRPSFRRFGSRLAIAATILLAIGAGALWLTIGRKQSTDKESQNAAVTLPDDVIKEIPKKVPAAPTTKTSVDPTVAVIDPGTKSGVRQTTIRRNRINQTAPNQRDVPEAVNPVLAANELREAEEGKARLMLALRYASTKLNVALKKSQGTNNRNLIHNQHRIG